MSAEYWKGKHVLVTGSTGLIGSWLCQALVDRGARVVGLSRDQIPNSLLRLSGYEDRLTLIYGSVTDLPLVSRILNEYEVDTCFHLAAQTIVTIANRSPLSTFDSNIRGTWTLLEAVRNASTVRRTVVASSDKAYGAKTRLPYEESDALDGLFPYDASKVMTELVTRSYAATYGLAVAITRCCNAYGGGDLNFSRIVPGTVRSLFQGESPIIRSDGTYTRDYLYVPDIVEGYLLLGMGLDRPEIRGEAFNFGSNTPISVLDLVKKIIDLYGSRGLEPDVQGKSALHGEIKAQFLSSKKAEAMLGWSPKHTLEEGLTRSIEWYNSYFAGEGHPPRRSR